MTTPYADIDRAIGDLAGLAPGPVTLTDHGVDSPARWWWSSDGRAHFALMSFGYDGDDPVLARVVALRSFAEGGQRKAERQRSRREFEASIAEAFLRLRR